MKRKTVTLMENAYNSEGRFSNEKNISKIYLGIIIILYNVFSYIYATDGLKIQLATKIQNNKYDYIKYNTLWSLSRFIYQ